MLKYFIEVITSLLINGIIIAMLFAVAKTRESKRQTLSLRIGLISGIAFAITFALVTHFTVNVIKRGYWNIGFMLIALAATGVFLLGLWGFLRKKAPIFNGGILNIGGAVLAGILSGYSLPGVFLFPTDFVLADESIFSTEFLLKLIGFLLGFFVVIMSMIAIYKAASYLKFNTVRILFTIALGILAIYDSGLLLQAMFNRWIKPEKHLFKFSTEVVNNSIYLLLGVMAVTIVLAVMAWIASFNPKDEYDNPAKKRKIMSLSRNVRRWSVAALVFYGIATAAVTGLKAYNERAVTLSPAEPFDTVGDEIHIPLEQINDGHLHRFAYMSSDGIEVRFIVIKKNDVAYGVGLDACDICGPTGYFERNGQVVCKLCDVVMNVSTIGFKGGCNPVPLAYTVSNGDMVVDSSALEAEKDRFK